jgi:hypothetical protein
LTDAAASTRSRPDALPQAPSLGGALRAAAGDFFFNSWRLVPANLLWALSLVVVALSWLLLPPLGLLVAVVTVLPTAGMFRLAALIARGEPASFSDATDAIHDQPLPRLGIGLMVVIAALVLLTNLASGVLSGSPLGWALATLAAWGLLAGWCWLFAFWPILLDPRRPSAGMSAAARLAALLLLAHPVRLALLGLVLAVLLTISLAALVALLTVSFAFAALASAHYVLPAADRLEARLGLRISPE